MRSSRIDGGCVLDSSAALALALDEPNGVIVTRLIASLVASRARLVAPPYFDVECASGLVKAVRRGRLDAETGAVVLVTTLRLPVERLRTPATAYGAFGCALEAGISAYDAGYVALSDESGLPLLDRPTGRRRTQPASCS